MPSHENTPHYEESNQEQFPESTGSTNEEVFETAPAPRWIIDDTKRGGGEATPDQEPKKVTGSYLDAEGNEWLTYEIGRNEYHTKQYKDYIQPDETTEATTKEQTVSAIQAELDGIYDKDGKADSENPQEPQADLPADVEKRVENSLENQTPTVATKSPKNVEGPDRNHVQRSLDNREVNRIISLEEVAQRINATKERLDKLSIYLDNSNTRIGGFSLGIMQRDIHPLIDLFKGIIKEDGVELERTVHQASDDQELREQYRDWDRLARSGIDLLTPEELSIRLGNTLKVVNGIRQR